MVTVVYGALVVCADGFISLLTDQDVVGDPGVGPLIAPIMGVVACGLVFSAVWRVLVVSMDRFASSATRAVILGLMVYLLTTVVGAVLYALGRMDAVSAILFLGRYLASPFTVSAGILALIVVAVVPAVAATSAVRDL